MAREIDGQVTDRECAEQLFCGPETQHDSVGAVQKIIAAHVASRLAAKDAEIGELRRMVERLYESIGHFEDYYFGQSDLALKRYCDAVYRDMGIVPPGSEVSNDYPLTWDERFDREKAWLQNLRFDARALLKGKGE